MVTSPRNMSVAQPYCFKHATLKRAYWSKTHNCRLFRCLECQAESLMRRRQRKRAAKTYSQSTTALVDRKGSIELSDWYVRRTLSRGTRVPQGAWPEWTVTLKREELRLKRALHQQRLATILTT